MDQVFDFVVVGGGSGGAVTAARLSEDPSCRVALIEAGDRPPAAESVPIACAAMQKQPETDWMYSADPGRAGLGLVGRRVAVPRGRMLGGSSGVNYMAYVRGHPGDFDSWAEDGASGWSYAEVLPYFRKSEGLEQCAEIVIDLDAHNAAGPLGVSVRSPVLQGARDFVQAAVAAGIPRGDFNGRDRGGAAGVASLMQTSTRGGRRSSTYRAFLEGEAEQRANLRIITHAQATRVLLSTTATGLQATGVAYRDGDGREQTVLATREVILSAGAVGSPHLLMLSGIGPRQELEAVGIECVLDSPHVGKHLKDHVQVPLFFPSSSAGIPMSEVALSLGPAALREPAGPLPADPADDRDLSPELQALKDEAERRINEWLTTGRGLVASSLYDAACWFSTGLGDPHSHDAQVACIPCGYNEDLWRRIIHLDTDKFFDDAAQRLSAEATSVLILANPVLPRSEGEIVIESADPLVHPQIRMNYFSDPHDLQVMTAVVRRAFDIAANWPGGHLGPWLAPHALAAKHGYAGGVPSDALIEDMALHFSITVYHLTSTCRIGSVVDARLRVSGVDRLRVADASVMPDVVSGNTNAACIMIGEKAAEMVAADNGVRLREFVGVSRTSLASSKGTPPQTPAYDLLRRLGSTR
jgi:choline dehydrogenase